MNGSITLSLVFVFLTASCIVAADSISSASAVENSWAEKAPMHTARGGLGVATVNGKIYALGGYLTATNEEYDPAIDTWTYKTPMSTPRYMFATAVYQNRIYCIGGATAVFKSDGYPYTGLNEVYDPATDTWETKTPMPTARDGLQANVVGGKIYLIGGSYPNGNLNEVYDPATDAWTTKAPMPTGAGSYASAVVDNKIYIMGLTLNQIYDPANDSWSKGASLPSNVNVAAGGTTTGELAPKRIFVFGCQTVTGTGPIINLVYNPNSDGWTVGADMPTSRMEFGVAVVNDTLYAIGGYNYSILNSSTDFSVNEQYIPAGYRTPDPTYQTPKTSPSQTPTPLKTPAQTSTPSQIISPTTSPSAIPQPNSSNSTPSTGDNLSKQQDAYWLAGAAVIMIVVIAVSAVIFNKRSQRQKQIK